MQEEVLKIISDVSKEYNIQPYVLERAYKSQFKLLRELIVKSRDVKEYPIVYIRYIGKFIPRKYFIERSDEFRKAKNKRDNGGLSELSDT